MLTLDKIKEERGSIKEHLRIVPQERNQMSLSDREIKGYAIVWDSINDYREMVKRGATLKSLNARGVGSNSGNKIQLLLQHDRTKILGEILELREDDYGLFFRASINEDIAYCEEALNLIKRGLLSQMSYGFGYIMTDEAMQYDEERDALILNEIVLYEISLVTFSSDPKAQLRSSYAASQAQMILSQFTPDQIRSIIDALSPLATADEATPQQRSATDSIISKF